MTFFQLWVRFDGKDYSETEPRIIITAKIMINIFEGSIGIFLGCYIYVYVVGSIEVDFEISLWYIINKGCGKLFMIL